VQSGDDFIAGQVTQRQLYAWHDFSKSFKRPPFRIPAVETLFAYRTILVWYCYIGLRLGYSIGPNAN